MHLSLLKKNKVKAFKSAAAKRLKNNSCIVIINPTEEAFPCIMTREKNSKHSGNILPERGKIDSLLSTIINILSNIPRSKEQPEGVKHKDLIKCLNEF